ncbi:MAG: hypothetical protein KF774_03075 [Planctomyces sp.]|nr:hypothetical protein [Planctomyces sp.]
MIRRLETPTSRCRFGLATADITPPVGMYHRMWGAATHDRSTGVHRPLLATAMAFAPRDVEAPEPPFVLLTVDHCLLWTPDMARIRAAVLQASGLPAERVVVTFSHTHGSGLLDPSRHDLPGGELIAPYLERLAGQLAELTVRALAALAPATITHARGDCRLAAHRDAWDEATGQFVCGLNPEGPADATVIVGRVTDASARPVAIIANYACHPTTLAWENTLISPDYIGAFRETVEREAGAPCVFLQGASGDLGPRHGYVGDVAIADRNGRELAYAALAALESMGPPDADFGYDGPVISGATLGVWSHRPFDASRRAAAESFAVRRIDVPLPYIPGRPDVGQLEAELREHRDRESAARSAGDEAVARDQRALAERATRALARWGSLPPGDRFPYQVTLLRLGDAIWVTAEGEPYQLLQTELRRRFPDRTLLVLSLADGWRCSYLPTRETYGRGIYQEQVAMLAAGALEEVIASAAAEIGEMLPGTNE